MPKRKFDEIVSNFDNNNDNHQCTAASYINLTTGDDDRVSCCLNEDEFSNAGAKNDRKVTYGDVTVFYFQRAQGFTCVPTSGGVTLGMLPKHYASESLTLAEHQDEIRRYRQSRLYEQQSNFLHQQHLNSVFPNSKMKNSNFEQQNSNFWSNLECENLEIEQNEGEDTVDEDDEDENLYDEEQQAQCSEEFASMPDEYYLQPLDAKQRRMLLKNAGVPLDKNEKNDCQRIRRSRQQCGCSCENGQCSPDTCACALDKIKCQVDRAQFPCACLTDQACANESGRVEFDTVRVRSHFLNTTMRLRLAQRFATEQNLAQPPSPVHTRFDHSEYDRKNSYLINDESTNFHLSKNPGKKFKFDETGCPPMNEKSENGRQNSTNHRQPMEPENIYSLTTLYTASQKSVAGGDYGGGDSATNYYFCSRNGYTHFSTVAETGGVKTSVVPSSNDDDDFCENSAGESELRAVLKKSICESVLA